MTIVISPGEGGDCICESFRVPLLDDRFTADPGFASTATGLTQLEEAVVCFN